MCSIHFWHPVDLSAGTFDFFTSFDAAKMVKTPVAFNPSQPAVQFSFQTYQQVGNVSIRMGLNKTSISRKHDRLLPNYEENKDCLAS